MTRSVSGAVERDTAARQVHAASLLVGLGLPDSGLVLLGGLDRHTLGAEGWRRRVAAAPSNGGCAPFQRRSRIDRQAGTFGTGSIQGRPETTFRSEAPPRRPAGKGASNEPSRAAIAVPGLLLTIAELRFRKIDVPHLAAEV